MPAITASSTAYSIRGLSIIGSISLGDAILQAKHLIQDEYFAILLADDLIFNNPSATQQLIKVVQETNSSVIGLNNVPKDKIGNYGVVSFAKSSKKLIANLLKGWKVLVLKTLFFNIS